jgi:hypothetical protein
MGQIDAWPAGPAPAHRDRERKGAQGGVKPQPGDEGDALGLLLHRPLGVEAVHDGPDRLFGAAQFLGGPANLTGRQLSLVSQPGRQSAATRATSCSRLQRSATSGKGRRCPRGCRTTHRDVSVVEFQVSRPRHWVVVYACFLDARATALGWGVVRWKLPVGPGIDGAAEVADQQGGTASGWRCALVP